MKRPSEYPNVPYAAFVDGLGPSVDQGYLNGTEEGLADVIGSLWGRSVTIVADEFTELTYPTSVRGKLDSWITTNTNSNWRTPTGANQHGILGVFAVAAGAATHLLQDALYGIGTVDFTVSMRVALDDRASLDTLAALGWFGGLRDGGAFPPSDAMFVAGNDSPNWQVKIGAVLSNTGVPIVDGRFYDLQIARISLTAYVYIDGALVGTQAYPDNLRYINRQLQFTSPAMPINKGYAVDYFRLGIMR